MNRSIVLVIIVLLFSNCTSSEDEVSEFDGRSYKLTSFILENAVDLDLDGIFSTNLFDELNDDCINGNSLGFRDNMVNAPIEYVPNLFIRDPETDNPIQGSGCIVFDYFTLFSYSVEGNIVTIGNDGAFIGIISENTITFNRTGLGTEIGQYITEEGLIESYQGTVVLIFTQME